MMKTSNLSYKWVALGLLWVAFFLQQGTRQLFGPSVPAICASLEADKVAVGAVGTLFAMTYGLCVPFAGLVADIFYRKWMVVIGVAVFCLGISLSGFATSVGVLLVTYGLMNGFGQTFYYPSASSLVSQLHKESRATAMSLLQLGLYFGIVGCGTLSGLLAGRGGEGWRLPFWVMGGVGLLWALVLVFCLRNTPPEVAAGAPDKPSVREALCGVATNPMAICITLSLAMMVYVDIGFKNWMPSFLRETYLRQMPSLVRWAGFHAVCWHYLGAIVGILVGSRLGDKLIKRRRSIRLELGAVGLAMAIPFIVWMANAASFTACCVAMAFFGVFRGVYDSNFMASFFDAVCPRYHASGVGVMMCVAFLFGSLSSTVLPLVSKAFGNDMALSMSSLGCFYLLGAIILLFARGLTAK